MRRFLNSLRPNRLEAEIQEEIEFHRMQSSGSFGNATLVADRMRDASTITWLETFLQDIRYGLSPAVEISGIARGGRAVTRIRHRRKHGDSP